MRNLKLTMNMRVVYVCSVVSLILCVTTSVRGTHPAKRTPSVAAASTQELEVCPSEAIYGPAVKRASRSIITDVSQYLISVVTCIFSKTVELNKAVLGAGGVMAKCVMDNMVQPVNMFKCLTSKGTAAVVKLTSSMIAFAGCITKKPRNNNGAGSERKTRGF